MWHLYIFTAVLSAGVVLKLVHPMMGRGRHRHEQALTKADRNLVYMLVLVVPVASLALYLALGRPDLRGAPALLERSREQIDRNMALLAELPFTTLVTRSPDDIGALLSLGDVNLRLKKYDEAILFFTRAMEEAKKKDDWRLRLIANVVGETQVAAAGGKVDDAAVKTFTYVLSLHPQNPIARYYLARRKAADGKTGEAVAEWVSLLNEGPPSIYWKRQVRESIAAAREDLKNSAEGGAGR